MKGIWAHGAGWILIIFAFFAFAANVRAEGTDERPDRIDMTKWLYNADADVYYQLGVVYCAAPVDTAYQTMGFFVPGAYFKGSDNGDGTYRCELNPEGTVGGFTPETAPIVLPVNTPGYSAMTAPTEYADFSEFTDAGFVVLNPGCRGRDHGAPAGVTDLKAAIRYARTNAELLPGDLDAIFTYGMSGGGAQSVLIGASGDSPLYDPYLAQIGAVQDVSDAVAGSMSWCPVTNLDHADEAYEWQLGMTRSGLSDEEQAISDALAAAYADYINAAGFSDAEGNALTLEASGSGIFQAGSYYQYMKEVVETSLENFLADTTFPYEASSGAPGGTGRSAGGPEGTPPDFDAANSSSDGELVEAVSYEALDHISRTGSSSGGLTLTGTYSTAQSYIDALNSENEWVRYDAESGEVEITSVSDFAMALKTASKALGAFDQLDAGQGENTLFGYGDGKGAHFDAVLARILADLGSSYAGDAAADLARTDALGSSVAVRVSMYTPLYYLLPSEAGYRTSKAAKYWRIRSGINQSDTALSTEVNLALALARYPGVEELDFATVWGQGHTEAERSGDPDSNFIEWVKRCAGE